MQCCLCNQASPPSRVEEFLYKGKVAGLAHFHISTPLYYLGVKRNQFFKFRPEPDLTGTGKKFRPEPELI